MNNTDFIDHLKDLLTRNLENTINELLEFSYNQKFKKINNNMIMMKSALNDLNNQHNNNLIDNENFKIEKAKIKYSVLSNINDLEDLLKYSYLRNSPNVNSNNKFQKTIKKLVIILVVATGLTFVILRLTNSDKTYEKRTKVIDTADNEKKQQDTSKKKVPEHETKITGLSKIKTSSVPCDGNNYTNFRSGKVYLNIVIKKTSTNKIKINWGDNVTEFQIISENECIHFFHYYDSIGKKKIIIYLLDKNGKISSSLSTEITIETL